MGGYLGLSGETGDQGDVHVQNLIHVSESVWVAPGHFVLTPDGGRAAGTNSSSCVSKPCTKWAASCGPV